MTSPTAQPTTTLNNGVTMPMVGFGVFQIPDPAVCQTAVEEAIATGYRLIDTAEAYQNEEAVGRAISTSIEKGIVTRDELFITTKAFIQHISYEGIKEAFAASLEKLGLDYIDLYLLHQPVGDTFGAWRAMEELYKEGKVRAIGVSNFEDDQVANLSIFNEITPAVNQIELHVFNQKTASVDYQLSKGVQVESWGAFAEGRFDVFRNPVLVSIAEQYGKSTAQVMLRWQLQRGIVILSKSANPERVRANFDIFDFSLADQDMAAIAELNTDTTVFADHHEAATVELLAGRVGKKF
ncbi:2,5-diketo-D-gluconic acid reductase [Alloscardovia macacae]|uniref:2,5-diketo-D-gluconic acid reductase n=1 Tax=Alloscardovia macacae TaxID=1160091 RepID=A0A1Y2T036_9BIFI|nr:aldo/keto reductase [Alloscardovia macacae]OTA26356.1 2,5-diketo-D-gluconic acid reductase [Alloscardovia macacae]OTA28838.1 2,5-diketo-D-gluconic acid reductase [Alloscardovia macacae]